MINLLKKLIPPKIKSLIITPLRRTFCHGSPNLPMAGKPGSYNMWWPELELLANGKIFPPLTAEAKIACKQIREAYYPILQRYGIDADDFFWGSIKNEEAEALYQLVIDRKPNISYQIGTFVGYSALVIAHAIRENGTGLLIAVDPEIPHRTFVNPVNIAREVADEIGLAQFIRFERGWHSGALGDYIARGLKRSIPLVGPELLSSISNEGIDLAFIDGDHSSVCTLTDFLMLKDYLNLDGIAVFHDVRSWPTVAQAIFLFLHDIHYFVRGTAAYFSLDVRAGQDGLAALERIAFENFPTLYLEVVDEHGAPIIDATVEIPALKLSAITDREGGVFFSQDVVQGVEIKVSCDDYFDYAEPLKVGTEGDYAKNILTLAQK